MIFELLFLLPIYIGGCALMSMTGLKGWQLPGVGFAVGIAIYIVIGTFQAITALSTSPVLSLGIFLLILAIWWAWFYIRRQNFSLRPIHVLRMVFIFIIALIILRGIVSLTPDSYDYLAIASLLESGNFHEVSPTLLLTRLIAVPIIHAPANLIDAFYLRSITPLLALSTLTCVAWLSYEGIKNTINDLRISQLFSIVAVLLLVSNNRFVFNAFYINGHMLTALFLLLMIGCGWLMIMKTEVPIQALMIILVTSIPVLTVTRPETSLLAGIALIPILVSNRIPWKRRAIILVVLGMSILIWHGFLWIKFSSAGEAVPTSVMAMFGLGVATVLATPILIWQKAGKLLSYSTTVAESGLWLMLFAFIYRSPGPFNTSVNATLENIIFDAGGWGVSLVFLFLIVIGVMALTSFPDRLILRFPFTTFIPLSFLLVYLRQGSYRVGYGDSLNRMFLHILPLMVLFVVSSVISKRWNLPEGLRERWNNLVYFIKGMK